jgi:hypothetical protein
MPTFHAALLVAPLVAAVAFPTLAGAEDSFRCSGGIVSIGDLKVDLLGKCGEPTMRETVRSEEVSISREGPAPSRKSVRETATVERWTYDFGRNQFIEVVTLEGGRIRSINRGSRGYVDSPSEKHKAIPVARCEYLSIRVGDSSYDLLARCGEPASRDLKLLERSVDTVEGGTVVHRSFTVPVEVWTFHFGPQTLTRIVELEEGKVLRVDTGSRGYAP